jgi:hypothetical protein
MAITRDETQIKIKVEFWPMDSDSAVIADLEVERDDYDAGRIALHTFIDGQGSKTSYYLDREAAIVLARNILDAAALG